MQDVREPLPVDYVREAVARKVLENVRSFESILASSSSSFLPASHYADAPSTDSQPIALIDRGIASESGRISLKTGKRMKLICGDMGGAATVVASTLAITKPVNLITVTPLTVNMPGPCTTKPGDIYVAPVDIRHLSPTFFSIYTLNGKSVKVDNTENQRTSRYGHIRRRALQTHLP